MRRPLPVLLRMFMAFGVVFGAFVGLSSIAFLVAAAGGGGPYMVQGVVVSRHEFMAFATPVLLGEVVLCVLSVGFAWGLFRRRYWARPLLLGVGVGSFLFSLLTGTLVGLPMRRIALATVSGGLALLVLWWVLYRRDDIVDWFEALREGD